MSNTAKTPEEIQAEKDAKLAQKEADKALKAQQAEEAKAQKLAEREAKKAEKEAEKEAKAKAKAEADAEKEALQAQKIAEKEAKEKAKEDAKAAKLAEKEASRMPEQNGVRRPKPDTLCGQAWAIFDEQSAATGEPATIGASLEVARTKELNEANVRTEYARWRKFNGVSGRLASPKKDQAETTEA